MAGLKRKSPGPEDEHSEFWLASKPLWTSPNPPHPLASELALSLSHKRQRREPSIPTPRAPSSRPYMRKAAPSKINPPCRPPPVPRFGNDVEDIGIVPNADPGPSSGSLLCLRTNAAGPFATKSMEQLSTTVMPLIPIDPNSMHIPSMQPLVNRQTLKELDLDAILRNPQLRHDILFDPGLQFRPTSSRRKREIAERYWAAVIREVESGCTCISFDLSGKPHPTICSCAHVPIPLTHPVLAYSALSKVLTLRMPTRIPGLLQEFLEVLLVVIQPLSSISGMYVNPDLFRAQMQEHTSQAAYIRQIFDPILIEQELKHRVFDPSSLFRAIGLTLKGHCAPMRDHSVEMMVQAAGNCALGGEGSKADAVKAVRMCMDILELMKLDIANHQLQSLRPFLVRTSGQFELRAFRNNCSALSTSSKHDSFSLRVTRAWLHEAHSYLLTRTTSIPHPLYENGSLDYRALRRNQQVYLAALKAITDLVFCPPTAGTGSNPETTYLDTTRLQHLASDAADLTATYMFLLLYRQLVYSELNDLSSPPARSLPQISEAGLIRLKKEIRDLSSTRHGYCFSCRCSPASLHNVGHRKTGSGGDWATVRKDIVLQIAMRARECREQPSRSPSSPVNVSSPTPSQNEPRCNSSTLSNVALCATIPPPPDSRILNLALHWADTNLQPTSPLLLVLRDKLRDVVFNAVVALAYPSQNGSTAISIFGSGDATSLSGMAPSSPCSGRTPPSSPITTPSSDYSIASMGLAQSVEFPFAANAGPPPSTGMEPLSDEIGALSEKVARLALIHLNGYLPLYEQDGFLDRPISGP